MRSMNFLLIALALLATATIAFAQEADTSADTAMLRRIYDAALTDSPAYSRLGDLVAKYPGRLSGSPSLAGAVQWAEATLKQQGVDRTELQPVKVPHWERGPRESVELLGAPGQPGLPLNALALGGSMPTSPEGLTAPVVELQSLAELKDTDVKGSIVFFNRAMRPQDVRAGTAYGGAGDQRNGGPSEAARYGAVAVLVRSLTHALDDHPHTGNTTYLPEVPRIPAAALSTLAADRLSAALKTSPGTQVKITINSRWLDDATSHNVIGELRGTVAPEKVLVVGGHLDSWDTTPGAHDDGAGVVQSMEVLRILQAIGYRPRHTIRCVLYTNEENGLRGGTEYARVAGEKREEHLLALESDAGGFGAHALQLATPPAMPTPAPRGGCRCSRPTASPRSRRATAAPMSVRSWRRATRSARSFPTRSATSTITTRRPTRSTRSTRASSSSAPPPWPR